MFETWYDPDVGNMLSLYNQWINTPEGRAFAKKHEHDGVSIDYLWRRDFLPGLKAEARRKVAQERERRRSDSSVSQSSSTLRSTVESSSRPKPISEKKDDRCIVREWKINDFLNK